MLQQSDNVRIDILIAEQFIANERQYCSFLCRIQCIKRRQN